MCRDSGKWRRRWNNPASEGAWKYITIGRKQGETLLLAFAWRSWVASRRISGLLKGLVLSGTQEQSIWLFGERYFSSLMYAA